MRLSVAGVLLVCPFIRSSFFRSRAAHASRRRYISERENYLRGCGNILYPESIPSGVRRVPRGTFRITIKQLVALSPSHFSKCLSIARNPCTIRVRLGGLIAHDPEATVHGGPPSWPRYTCEAVEASLHRIRQSAPARAWHAVGRLR